MKSKISILDSFEEYEGKLKRSEYNKVIKAVNKKIYLKTLTGKQVNNPFGKARIFKYKAKAQNKKLSYDLKKKVNYSNLHTDGYTCKFILMPFHYLKDWSFYLLRTYKRKNFKAQHDTPTMAEYIREHGVDHFVESKTSLK